MHVKTIATGSYQQSCRPGIYCTHQPLLIAYPLKGRNRWENKTTKGHNYIYTCSVIRDYNRLVGKLCS